MNVKHKRWTYVCDAYMNVYAWDKYMYERNEKKHGDAMNVWKVYER